MPIKQEVVETRDVVEMCQPPPLLSTPALETEKKECKLPKKNANYQKKRKAKPECEIVAKIVMKNNNTFTGLTNCKKTTTHQSNKRLWKLVKW